MKAINPQIEELVDIRTVSIDLSKSLEDRQREFIDKIKNPNQFRYKNIVVNINHKSDVPLEDKIVDFIMNRINQKN